MMLGLWFTVAPAFAHGTNIQMAVLGVGTIEVRAAFDTGEPMGEAQLTVFSADNPQEAWHTGVADSEGVYTFQVDTTISGEWAISIRTAGHGEILHFDVANDGTIQLQQNDGRPLWLTIALSAGVVIGLGGIAYWYSQPKEAVSI